MPVVGLRTASVSLLAVAMLLSGCDRTDQQIKVYRVVKAPLDSTPSPDGAMSTNGSSPSSASEASPDIAVSVAVPSDWEPQTLSQMRQASFLVHGENGAVADISFVTLGPAAGNTLDNVNRWLAQLAQPPITAEKLASTVQQLPTAQGDIAIVDLSGEPENGDSSKDGRIIGAIAPGDGRIAFFKMRGNPALVGSQKDNFVKWVSSSRGLKVATSAANAELPANADKPQIKWDVPQGWSSVAASAMRYASFAAEQNGEKADISVVTFAGDGGSDADNVNRWRQQIGLPAMETGALSSVIASVQAGQINFSTIDMTGATARVVAGWARHDGRVWFFKLTGPASVVEQEKPKFVKFLESVRF